MDKQLNKLLADLVVEYTNYKVITGILKEKISLLSMQN